MRYFISPCTYRKIVFFVLLGSFALVPDWPASFFKALGGILLSDER